MMTIYHNLDPNILRGSTEAAIWDHYQPNLRGLELAAIVTDTDNLMEAFDRVIHRDGENWTDNPGVLFFGDPRGRRSSHEGDVFVNGDAHAYLALPHGFRALPGLKLPYLP